MSLLAEPWQPQPASPGEFLGFVFGYLHLLAAAWDAHDAQVPPRQRPVSLARLRGCSIDDGILLWMLYQAHVEILDPPRPPKRGGNGRTSTADALIWETNSFALTDAGETFAGLFLGEVLVPDSDEEFVAGWNHLQTGLLVPHYDSENRVFTWGRQLLKRFRQPSGNQEIVLRAAEELAWPGWFDDPLPGRNGRNPKACLHNTIKDLNRRQEPYVIHFKGDGTGRRIGWELRGGSARTAPPEVPQSNP